MPRRRSIDLWTSYQTGFKGAPIATQPQWNYNPSSDLPPRRQPPGSVDLLTLAVVGFITHGAAAAGPIDASLPPVGRGPSVDLRTSYVPGRTAAPIVQVPQYDTSLPPAGARNLIALLPATSAGFEGPPIAPQPQWNYSQQQLPPQGRGTPPDIWTWVVPGSHGAVAQTQNDDALPPRGRGPSIEPTWVIPGRFTVALAHVPAYDTSLPPVAKRGDPESLTAFQAGFLGSPIATQLQWQYDTSLPPLGLRRVNVDLLTWVVSGKTTTALVVQVPQYDTSLPPLGRGPSVDLRTAYQAGSFGAVAARPIDTSLPPVALRQQHPSLLPSAAAGFEGDPIAVQPQWNYEYPLPPKGVGPSIELLTWVVPGRVTAQLAQIPFYDTSLPPLGRGASVELRTGFQSGFVSDGAVQQKQNDDSLPPLGHGSSPDLRIAYVAGLHGAPAQWQYDQQPLPPVRARASVDLLTSVVFGHAIAQTFPIPFYDTSLPPVRARATPDLLTSVQTGFVGAPIAPQPQWNYDAQQLPPRGRGPSVEPTWVTPGFVSHGAKAGGPIEAFLPPFGGGAPADIRTWFVPGSYGAVAQTQNDDTPLPPRGRGPSVELLTWTVSGRVTAQLAQVPFYDTSLPPLGRGPSIDLRTSYQSGFISHGAKAQTLYDNILPPLGRGAPVDIRTWLQPGSHGAKGQTQYDNILPPLGRGRSIDTGTSFQPGSHAVRPLGSIIGTLRDALFVQATIGDAPYVAALIADSPAISVTLGTDLMANYIEGDTVSFSATFAVNGVAYDPGVLTCKVQQPDNTVVDISSSIIRQAAGSYLAQFTVTQMGQLNYEWLASTGSVSSVSKGYLLVDQAAF